MAGQHNPRPHNLRNGVKGDTGSGLPDYSAVEHELFHVAEYSVVCEYEHGRKVTVGVSPADTLYDLQQRFTAVTGIVPAERHLRFYFHDTLLSPAKSLSAQGVWDGSVISVQSKEKQPPDERGVEATAGTQGSARHEELPSYESITQESTDQTDTAGSWRSTRQAAALLLIPYLAIFYGLPISLIVVGAKEDCDDSRITSWMVVFGVCVLWLTVFALALNFLKLRRRMQGEDAELVALRFGYFTEFQSVLQTFLGIWVVCGSVWVYGCSHECRRKCSTTAFNLAFWTLTGAYIFITVIVCTPFFTACTKRCFPSSRGDRRRPRRSTDALSTEDLRRVFAMLTEQAQAQEEEAAQPQPQLQQQREGAVGEGASTVGNTGSSSSGSASDDDGGVFSVRSEDSSSARSRRGSDITVVHVHDGVRGGRGDDDNDDDDDDDDDGDGRGDDRSGTVATAATAGTTVTIQPGNNTASTWDSAETLV